MVGSDITTSGEPLRKAHGFIQPKYTVTDFDRKAAFHKLAFWLREYGKDDDMAHFIEKIALKKNFARDYRVNTHLLKMMVRLFKAAEKYLKPTTWIPVTASFDNRKALQKEVTLIRAEINRLLHTIYRGTKRKPYGGTRDESRGSPAPD
jgi:hypothetical protein